MSNTGSPWIHFDENHARTNLVVKVEEPSTQSSTMGQASDWTERHRPRSEQLLEGNERADNGSKGTEYKFEKLDVKPK